MDEAEEELAMDRGDNGRGDALPNMQTSTVLRLYDSKPSIGQQISAFRLVQVLACLSLVDGMSYVCLFPSNIRPGCVFNVAVTLFQAPSPVNLEASITSTSGSVISSQTAVANNAGVTTLIPLAIPLKLSSGLYVLKVSGTGGLVFTNSSKVKAFLKPASILIQTDKVMYRPGQLVRFRVVAIYPTMKPYTGEMDITIVDDKDHKIAQWKHKDPNGVFSGELHLSSRTPLGLWKIEVVIPSSDAPTMRTFEVTTYELPSFEVTIRSSLNYFLLINKPQSQRPLSIPVTAKYVYGESVKGVVNFAVSIIEKDKDASETDPVWKKTMTLVDGTVTAEMSPADLSSIMPSSLKSKSPDQPWTQLGSSSINIKATVTETATGDEISSSLIVLCHVHKYALYFSNITSGSFKPEETYTGYLELKQNDGSELTESDVQLPNKDFKQIAITFKAGQGCPAMELKSNFPLTKSGFVQFSFEAKDFNCDEIITEASFQDELSSNTYSVSQTLKKFKSNSKNYIRVDLDKLNSAYKTGEALNFNIKTTQGADAFYYVVMSKGSIILGQTVANPSNPYSLKLTLTRDLAQKLAPRGRFVVWFVADKAEVISDSLEFNVQGAFANEVSIAHAGASVKPGQPVRLQVRGAPGSAVFLLGVDKSVLLLKGDNDINQDMVINDLMTYDIAYDSVKLRGQTSQEIFYRSMLSFMTDGFVYSNVEESMAFQEIEAFEITRRMCFPETWIWTNTTLNANGVGYVQLTVPDTITTWIASVFAMHPEVGLGIAPFRDEIKVFLSFFVSAKFPSLVRNGEEFAIRVTVYNFLNSDETVTVTLKASRFFDVKQRTGVLQNKDITRQIQVPRKDGRSVSYWIITKKPGKIPIVISAKMALSEDIETRILTVIPEGVEQFYSTSMFLDLKKGAPDFKETFKIELPVVGELVPFSQNVMISVVGDILGPSIVGVGDLVSMPGACGEQKMINIAPAVYMLDYLDITKSLTGDLKVAFENQLLDGYQQAMTAQRVDKSFSAWGDNDTTGSVWLSAFVVKTFNAARHKNRIPVETEDLADTLTWILTRQGPTGSFSEPDRGRVYHVEMQGESGNGVSLTAYILITLIESKNIEHMAPNVLEESISKAVAFLEGQLDSINDPYALSIITYALVLANSKRAGDAQKKLEALAHVAMGQKHWGEGAPVVQTTGVFNPPYVKAPAKDVEMTSYALLTYVTQKKLNEALPIVKWLISQRQSEGGFVSTQDTVVALEALTRYAKLASGVRSTVKLIVKAKASAEEKTFQPIDGNNVFRMQRWEPKDATVKTIDISASGFGKAIVQMDVTYYVRHTSSIKNNGAIDVDVTTDTNDKIVTIKTCTSLPPMSKKPTGMALETIEPVSGCVPIDLDEVDTVDNIKQLEVNGHQVTVYYEKLDGNMTCTLIKMKKEFAILNTKNASVTVMDYYNPGNFVTKIYGFDEPKATWQSLCPTCDG